MLAEAGAMTNAIIGIAIGLVLGAPIVWINVRIARAQRAVERAPNPRPDVAGGDEEERRG